jgi:predicted porin
MLTGARVGEYFGNFDGLSRIERVRYDSPEFFGGLTVGVTLGEDDQNDIAFTYAGTAGAYRFEAGIAWSESHARARVNGSASILHERSGISVTLAAGRDDPAAAPNTPRFGYAKLGYKTRIWQAGPTAFAVDYYDGSDQAVPGSASRSVGVMAVRTVEAWNTEFYAAWRTYDVSAPGASYRDLDAVLVGARIQF